MTAARFGPPIVILLATGPGVLRELLWNAIADQSDMVARDAPTAFAPLSQAITDTQARVLIVAHESLRWPETCERLVTAHPRLVVLAVSPDEKTITTYNKFPTPRAGDVVRRVRDLVQMKLEPA